MSKARDLSNFISDATVDATEIADLAVTHAKLHTDMNLSSKTLTLAANQISGNSVDGGVISNFASTGIDDNASATAITILSNGKVGIGTASPQVKFEVQDNTTWDVANFSSTSGVGAGFTMNAQDTGVEWSLIAQGTTGGGNDNNLGFHLTNAGTSGQSAGYKFVMTPSGHVGIGTTSPSTMLHLSAGTTGSVGGSHAGITMTNKYDNPDNSWSIKPAIQGVSNTGLEIRDVTDNRSVMVFDGSGNVGIGLSTNIASKLHVNSELSLGPDNNNRMIVGSTSGGVGSIGTIENGTASFSTMTFKGGKVGIGATSPGRELHVYNATEANIKIQAGSDYAELRVKDSDDRFSMHYNGSQVIALDSNEIFIHKNTSGIGTQGAYFNSNYSHITSTNDSPLALNRLGNNNNLNYALDVRKDSTNAGGISVQDTWNSTKTSSFHPMSSHTYGYGLHGLNLHGYDVGRLDQSNTFDGNSQSGAYMPGITGTSPKNMKYLVLHFQVVGNNVYYPFMINMNDVKGVLEIVGGDASSRGYKRWYVNYTSTAYGVYGITQAESVGGGWNSGSFDARVEAPNGALAVGFKFSSYYSSTNVASFKAIWRAM